MVLAAGLASVPPVQAEPVNSSRPKVQDHERTVKGKDLQARPRTPDPAGKPGPAAKAVWPKHGTAEAELPRDTNRSASAPVRAGDLPVWLGAPSAPENSHSNRSAGRPSLKGRVKVSVLDHKTSRNIGAGNVVLTLTPTKDATAGLVGVRLDYASFAQAFGAAYGTRLRLVQLPACALTTPDKAECRTPTPVASTNNGEAKTVTADVETTPAAQPGAHASAKQAMPTVLAASPAPAGSQGDFKATTLEASATWKHSGNTGDFTWNYPMRVPPVPGGLAPKVDLGYSAQSVDGRTGNTNSQPSWAGEGFDFWPGFIERRYKSCEEDGVKNAEGKAPGDLCWGYDNATVTWNGKGGELVKAADNTWRLKNDDGTRFERLLKPDTGNGDNDGEYWKVTTTDGTRYYFGLNRLPGFDSGGEETNSAWTVPVFGDDANGPGTEDDEPCHKATGFADSWCQQAWRWNLDLVVDPNGNANSYYYAKENNHYGRNLKPADATPYTRGGYLKSIEYGLRENNAVGAPPARVLFETSERCIPDASFDCSPAKIATNPDKWWDVPWDMNCEAGTQCTADHGSTSPTFWSRKRLTKVTTQVTKGAGWPYRNVDSWTLDHQWGAVNDERDLLVKDIQHLGLAGATTADNVTLPKVTFNHVPKANRVDQANDGIVPYTRYRVSKIFDESGGEINIDYTGQECSRAAPPTPQTNAKRCFPSIWHLPGQTTPITDWFNKYVTTSVVQKDRTGGAPDMATRYEYIGDAAWHFDDDDGLTPEKYKTWSQWRGYGQVRVKTGNFASPSTQTDTYYLRGMHGDRANPSGGTKQVSVPDGEGGTHTDAEGLEGFSLKTVRFTSPGGAVHDKTVNAPWRHQTASRTRSWGTVTANATQVDSSRTWTAMDGGTWRQTKTSSVYETDFAKVGRVKQVNDLGDVSITTDDRCGRTEYADNVNRGMVAFPSRVETVSVECGTAPDRSKHVISDDRTSYDNGAHGEAPSKGNVTKTEKIAEHDGGTARYVTDKQTGYDIYGRPTSVTDVAGRAGTFRYTDVDGLTTKVVTTTPPAVTGNQATALASTAELDPARGVPTARIDANGLRTDLVYDALGRVNKVWQPDRSKTNNQSPNLEYAYRVADGQIVAVTTKTLTNTGSQRIDTIELYDGWLRSRQTQEPGPAGRLIADTFHNDRGKIAKNFDDYSASGTPEPTLFGVTTPGAVETQKHYSYDGLDRPTLERLLVGNGTTGEKWRTAIGYGGNWRTVDPPEGGTPTAEITDARGQVVERREYQGTDPTGAYNSTAYTYDPAGRPKTVKDPAGNTWTHTYDLRGRKIKTEDPDAGVSTSTYDDLDRQESITDARDKTITNVYDGLDRKTQTREGTITGRLLTSWTYDSAARGKGKAASSTRHAPGGDYVNQVPGYDVLGRPESFTFTVPSGEGALAGSYSFAQTYNLDGTLKDQTLPAAGGLAKETLAHSYDAFERPTRLTSELATYVGATDYTPTGKPKMVELGISGKRAWNTLTWQYGTQRLETSRTHREAISGDDRNAIYTYDDAGNIRSISDTSTAGVDRQCFRYDHLRRLTDAWTAAESSCPQTPAATAGPAPYRFHYTYKTDGSRKREELYGTNGALMASRDYRYQGDPGVDTSIKAHRLGGVDQTGTSPFTGPETNDETYTYDAAGNPTNRKIGSTAQTLTWDSEGQLEKATENGQDTSFINDADGNRLIRKDASGTTLYLPETELHTTPGASTVTGTRYYTHNGDSVAMRDTTGGLRYLTGDHQGTAQIAINASDQKSLVRRFTPFGQERGVAEEDTWPGEKGFVNGTKDPTGLTHLGARDYDPNTGRFNSVDPVFNAANPQQMNGYTYAQNNPVTDSDPTGTCSPLAGCPTNPQLASKPDPSKAGVPPSEEPKLNGCTGHQRSMPGFCERGLQQKLEIVISKRPPPPSASWRHTFNALKWAFGGMFGVEDIQKCVTGKSASSCAWAGIGLIPYVGKAAKPAARAIKATRKARKTQKCSSFVPGTRVLLADGTTKAIEDVNVGDKVLATNPGSGKTEPKTVQATITSKGEKRLVAISIDTQNQKLRVTKNNKHQSADADLAPYKSVGKQAGLLIATDEHPFWVAGDINTWVKAADLKPGMWLRTGAGTFVEIAATETRAATQQRVHNLTVADHHTYYAAAGAAQVLVHNCGPRVVDMHGRSIQNPDVLASRLLQHTRQALSEWTAGSIGYSAKDLARIARKPSRANTIKGNILDGRVKALADSDPDLNDLFSTPSGMPGPDWINTGSTVPNIGWYDLTTERMWGQHVFDYSPSYGPGVGILWR
ncbi:polymorphic toxin-type HINT domain-containing protein [Spirillospora sp. CA-294931]|uniref:polymorphic toxin-type HINT domain-containing protein n=1 Tax=Spirillospora sp. CA-294931 TaxID=3240042 RepID=UPI003D8B4967